ncbi:MAG: universal stress protein, partial [Burkholderiaceae bacterium]
ALRRLHTMRILLAVDGSKFSRAAVEFVASRSTLTGVDPEVHLLNVQLPVPPHAARAVGKDSVTLYYSDEAEKALKPARSRLDKAGFAVIDFYTVGHPGEQIAAAAVKSKADLIVLGSHGHSALRGLLFGSVTNAVMAQTTAPVLIVRAKETPPADSLKVGIAIDGSKYGRQAVKYVLRHGELFGKNPTLSLIHVVQDFANITMPDMVGIALPTFTEEEARALHEKAFESAVAPVRKLMSKAKVAADEVRLIGNPGDELAAYAKKKKLDLLVMGSHGYGAFKAAIMGSVTTRVAAASDVALLLVR